jgi:hypothetical protein
MGKNGSTENNIFFIFLGDISTETGDFSKEAAETVCWEKAIIGFGK